MKAFFKDRYDASHQAGVEKLQNGTIPLFPGVSEVLRNDLIVAVKLKDLNGGLSELLRDLGRLEEGQHYSFFMARRDFPHHVTIQVAAGGHEAQSELESGVDYVDSHLLTFNRLVLDGGGNIVLMNEGVPAAVSEWRGWATQVMTEHDGVPKPLPIFHSTVARIQRFNYSIAAAVWLTKVVEDWNVLLQKRPLEFVSQGTFVGTTYDLLTT
ncbi:hypothetical protein A3I99_02005 [Candidatus Kaiserbacteria bacterium RIFCSPLOWO2_02_FULL_45_11b]|uniref:Uncharacterized protein n=1 Tax=Candidatus Kaiserbacteria bacterium RIFCSPLOWO2_12_FULL_45_26 TaxID=1798525 RepID=A0A1F6FHK7_9BACT|nr:MAG: hypothetical protein A2Z56_04860 [Candidatus Kaiserbacteria bacterium RIFCSPHIGHO2_12_45_16]OGG70169.1 MAG: hypothetical protein A2929_03745 [Candidatus Kaiserbacteria bacterium RIFCSPLOWO2_01_FULL_45_25]OGG81838.1 MAG: hypothetical protein A3I99_02005 [Candidatus Kaiserbacteria bacterium RIFCSPLOWO2_02_FULL_45_11b]OGG85340.1 MAG: hypothetical protein A3G90_04805 [Candidatus Kaiserbacteria bacterium RIFCSPLOWO2_12_FULL_45_26]